MTGGEHDVRIIQEDSVTGLLLQTSDRDNLFGALSCMYTYNQASRHHSVVCRTTSPYPLPMRVPHRG